MDTQKIFAALEVDENAMPDSNAPIGNFTGAAGENSSATGVLSPGEIVAINGNEDLHTAIQFNDGGCVYGIRLEPSPGFYDYAIFVDAQGPKGAFSGNGYLYFTDETGKEGDKSGRYLLKIYSSRRSTHVVRYDSKMPKIVRIEWGNDSIK